MNRLNGGSILCQLSWSRKNFRFPLAMAHGTKLDLHHFSIFPIFRLLVRSIPGSSTRVWCSLGKNGEKSAAPYMLRAIVPQSLDLVEKTSEGGI